MKKGFAEGVRMTLPICLGVIPIGISFGVMSIEAGLRTWEAVAMSAIVMAGSSQIMAVGMIAQGAAGITIVIATFFLNLRHIVMSASVMDRLRGTALWKKLAAAFALCDESFAAFSLAPAADYPFLLGADAAMYITWIISTAAGCLAHRLLPEIVSKSFGIAIYAAFLGMLLPNVRKSMRFLLLVLLTALLNTLFQLFLPASWALILAMIAGAAAGVFFVEEETL